MKGLSVLTLMKDRKHHLANLIEGLRRSDRVPDELIVVDMDEDWNAPLDSAFPIHVAPMRCSGLPLAEARNVAAKAASYAHLLFLDVDCIPMSGLLGAVDAHLTDYDRLRCAEVRYLDARVETGWCERTLMDAARTHPVRKFPSRGGVRLETNPGLFWSLAFGIRRSSFFRLGGFDEAFHGYGAEDTDFGFRASAAGLQLAFLGGPGAFHQHHDVYNPPLQHFDDILRNATLFRRKWNVWPMGGWLDEFQTRGLIDISPHTIDVIRRPSGEEIAAAKTSAAF